MITITNNQGGQSNELTVTRGAYETFYKRLGYTIKDVSAEKADTPKKEEPKVEEITEVKKEVVKPKEKVVEPKKEKGSKNKKISD